MWRKKEECKWVIYYFGDRCEKEDIKFGCRQEFFFLEKANQIRCLSHYNRLYYLGMQRFKGTKILFEFFIGLFKTKNKYQLALKSNKKSSDFKTFLDWVFLKKLKKNK